MSRSARFVWTKAIQNVEGLPQCPPDMTEPQYSSLLFEQLCCVRGCVLYDVLELIHDVGLGMRKRPGVQTLRASSSTVLLGLRQDKVQ